jgi:O-antigen/teichoic acid export membrane protein
MLRVLIMTPMSEIHQSEQASSGLTPDSSNEQLTPSLLQHGKWVFIGRIASAAIAAIYTVFMAKVLSQAEFGRYSTLIVLSQMFAVVGIFGLDQAILREAGRTLAKMQYGGMRDLLRTVARWAAISNLVAITITALILVFFGDYFVAGEFGGTTILGVVLLVSTRALIQLGGETCRALNQPAVANLFGGGNISPCAALVSLVMVVVASQFLVITGSLAVWCYAIATLFPLGVIGGTLWNSYRRLPAESEVPDQRASASLTFRTVVQLFWISVAPFLSSRTDIVYLSYLSTPENVAVYEAARRLTMLLGMPLLLLNTTILTFVSRLYFVGRVHELQRILRTTAAWASIPALIGSVACLLFPQWIMATLFRPEYAEGASLLRILVLGQLTFVLSGSCGTVLVQTGHAKLFLLLTSGTVVFVLAGAPVAIQLTGPIGLAWIIAIAVAVENTLAWILARRVTTLWTHPDYSSLFRQSLASTFTA